MTEKMSLNLGWWGYLAVPVPAQYPLMLALLGSQYGSHSIPLPPRPARARSNASKWYFCPGEWSWARGIQQMLTRCNISWRTGMRPGASMRCGSLHPRDWGGPCRWWRWWTCSCPPPVPAPRWGSSAPWDPGRCTAPRPRKYAQTHLQLSQPKTFNVSPQIHKLKP